MSGLRAAIETELLKSRRSRVPWAVAIGFTIAPLVSGLFMIILKDPDRARQLGLLGQKAQLVGGTADWPSFLGMLSQAVAVGGAVLFAFLTAWVFGREFADRTIRGLLASPTARASIVTAKMLVVAAWSVVIAAWVLVLGLAVGAAVDLPGWSAAEATGTLAGTAAAAVLTIGLQTVTALFATIGRGYMPALGWAVATIAAAQILAVLGWGALFPWSVPALVAGAGGDQAGSVEIAGLVAVAIVVIGGFAATVTWWRRADQTG